MTLPFFRIYNIARSLIDIKQYDEARRILTEVYQKEPNAEAYMKMGDLPQAVAHYAKALQINPNNATHQQ